MHMVKKALATKTVKFYDLTKCVKVSLNAS